MLLPETTPLPSYLAASEVSRQKETRYCGLKGGLDQEEINASR
jgi:hypothetical protein